MKKDVKLGPKAVARLREESELFRTLPHYLYECGYRTNLIQDGPSESFVGFSLTTLSGADEASGVYLDWRDPDADSFPWDDWYHCISDVFGVRFSS